jgi:hypothetical protein
VAVLFVDAVKKEKGRGDIFRWDFVDVQQI